MKKLLYISILSIVFLAACAAPDSSGPPDTLKRYQPNELREYNGTHLDPAIAPVENSITGVQAVDISTYMLTIDGLVQTPKQFTYADVTAMPAETKLVTLTCVEGWDITVLWKGVLMADLLNAASVKPEAKTVIFHAIDGYTTSLPLKEILDGKLMLAYGANGLPLPPEMGYPFIFVAEGKWGYKWARWVNRIELSADTNYFGYWEQYGYSNEGNVTPKP